MVNIQRWKQKMQNYSFTVENKERIRKGNSEWRICFAVVRRNLKCYLAYDVSFKLKQQRKNAKKQQQQTKHSVAYVSFKLK